MAFCLKTVVMLIVVFTFSAASAADGAGGGPRVVDGVAIYLGVMPAEIIQGHPREHEEGRMHGGVPAGRHRDHLVLALFDDDSGERIEDAQVSAGVMELGLRGQWKTLEPMRIAGTITYGNYFDMPDEGTYHIRLRIRRPGSAGVIEAVFTHRHFE